jgi:TonB family protein
MPVEKSTFAEHPTSKPTEPQDRPSADAKPKISLPVPAFDMSASVDAICRKKSTEVTLAPEMLSGIPSQPSTIVSNISNKSQATNPVRTRQDPASSASLSEGSLTKVYALLGIKRVASSEPASADQPSILKSTHETPAEIKSTHNTALPQPLPARESHSVPASNVASERHSTEIPESTASVPRKMVDSPWAELRPRVVAWLAARRLQLRSSIGVALLCIILAFACIGLGIAIDRSAFKRAPNIANANEAVSQEGSSPVAMTKGETLTSKPIASPDSAGNNRTGSAVERIRHGQTSPARRAASWTFSIKTSISPSPTPVDALLATTPSGSKNSAVVPMATSASSKNMALPVVSPTSPTPSPDSRGTVPLALGNGLQAQQAPDRVVPSHLIYRVEPFYPKEALQQGVEGTVRIHLTIGQDGRVRNLRVLSGPALLNSAALDAAQDWRYMPALRNGEPVEAEEDVSVEFHHLR